MHNHMAELIVFGGLFLAYGWWLYGLMEWVKEH
jgi:cbb3-type cytochrome oxidase subunit 3